MDNVYHLKTRSSHTYRGVEYVLEYKRSGLITWDFVASQLGLPMGDEFRFSGTGGTLQDAHSKCQKRIDVLLETAGQSVGTAASA